MRSYLVIPAGTSAYVVQASRPRHAASKAQHAKGEAIVTGPLVIAMARTQSPDELPPKIPGQLSIEFASS